MRKRDTNENCRGNYSLSTKLVFGFCLGTLFGYLFNQFSLADSAVFQAYLGPALEFVGEIFIKSLKAIVVPIVFFSLITGAANMPLKESGRFGARLMGLYLLTSVIATIVGLIVALQFAPGKDLAMIFTSQQSVGSIAEKITSPQDQGIFSAFLSALDNPFASLSNGNFLGFILFAITFGFALSKLREQEKSKSLTSFLDALETINKALMVIVHWVMEIAPYAIAALAFHNFSIYGGKLIGPYLKTVLGIVIAVLFMILGVYGMIVYLSKRMSVFEFLRLIKVPMITAFATRSSAATLPASIEATTDNLHVPKGFANFSLPIGATVNMDGVCVHLPMFAILAANIYGIEIEFMQLVTLTISTVLAAVGAGGVPGGSLMLLFMILTNLGLNDQQISLIVAIALGVNPILDMFETMNNVTGDIACTFAAAPLIKDDH